MARLHTDDHAHRENLERIYRREAEMLGLSPEELVEQNRRILGLTDDASDVLTRFGERQDRAAVKHFGLGEHDECPPSSSCRRADGSGAA